MLETFLQYLSIEKRFSAHTCLAYKKDVVQFLDFAGINDDEKSLNEVSGKLVRGWIVELMEKDYKSISVNRKLSSLRTYFKWLLKEGKIAASPMQVVRGPKNEKRLPSFVQSKDLEKEKVSVIFNDDFDGVRDHLMFELLYQTGIRLSELIGLRDSDVSIASIKVLGKRNKERVIPISSDVKNLIEKYLALRSKESVIDDNLLLLKSGKKLYPKFVYRKINGYLGNTTNLDKRSPHVLRHTFATHMLNNGAGLEVLKELLGHASLSATQVYTHNSFSELTKIYSQSHPRGH